MSKYIGETEEEDIDDYEYDQDGNIVYYAVRPNKTQIKKEYTALFAVGEEMAKLSPANLLSLDLPLKIHEAVTQVSSMPLNNARKRLLKYIAGQLYKIEHRAILEQLAKLHYKNAHATREHHLIERWRDRLLVDGNKALTALLDEYPRADRQVLRQLMRNAQKEADGNKAPKSARLLYQHLKELFNTKAEDDSDLAADAIIDEFEDEEDITDFDFDADAEFDEEE